MAIALEQGMKITNSVIKHKMFAIPSTVVPPASPEVLLRTSMMATHTQNDINDALEILERIGKKEGILKG